MKITAPSALTISNYIESRLYGLNWAAFVAINALMKACDLNKPTPEDVHKIIDNLLGNHGVESFRVKVRGQVRTLYYSNAGDTYTPTVMRWDWIDGGQRRVIWLVGSWGDIAEKYPEVTQ